MHGQYTLIEQSCFIVGIMGHFFTRIIKSNKENIIIMIPDT